jgi:toxin HigB-1
VLFPLRTPPTGGKTRIGRSAAGATFRLTQYVKRNTLEAVIETFRSRDTERLFHRERVSRFVNIESVALRRLVALDSARRLSDLLIPPSNRLEALRGDRAASHSIRINDQYRVCFRWHEGNAYDVEIVDYH